MSHHTESGGVLCYTLRKFRNFECLSVRLSISASFLDSNLSSLRPILFKLWEEWFGIANGLKSLINNREMALD